MSQIEKNLTQHNLTLPELGESKTLFSPAVVSGNLLFISGQLPTGFGDISLHVGQLGKNVSDDAGKEIAKICMLNCLAQAKKALGGSLEKLKKCVKITVFVNSTSEFTAQPSVANGASEVIVHAFGAELGKHSRSAIGVSQLPLGVAVEVEAIFEI